MKTNYNAAELEFINVFDDSYPLYEYCRENRFTECESYDEWFDNGGELSFFEGDPDMIKVNGEVGYFCQCGNKVFFYFDDWGNHNAEKILRGFFAAFNVGITIGGESWMRGECPKGVSCSREIQSWDMWEKIRCGIAYRGGAGYTYTIQSWGNYLRYAA